jgi:hypothetical protein
LFDLAADPREQRDIAEQERELRERMLDELDLVRRALQAEPTAGRAAELTAEEREHLASLGYLQSGDPPSDN